MLHCRADRTIFADVFLSLQVRQPGHLLLSRLQQLVRTPSFGELGLDSSDGALGQYWLSFSCLVLELLAILHVASSPCIDRKQKLALVPLEDPVHTTDNDQTAPWGDEGICAGH